MSNALEQLYYHFTETIRLDPEATAKMQALAAARLAVMAELDQCCDEKYRVLLEVLDSLESENQELHSKALFAAALETGMALGRLQVS